MSVRLTDGLPTMSVCLMTKTLNVGVSPLYPAGLEKWKHAPQGWGGGNIVRLSPHSPPTLVKLEA